MTASSRLEEQIERLETAIEESLVATAAARSSYTSLRKLKEEVDILLKTEIRKVIASVVAEEIQKGVLNEEQLRKGLLNG